MKKSVFYLSLIGLATFALISCSEDEVTTVEPALAETVFKQIEDLAATQVADYTTMPPTISGDFIKFNFAEGQATQSETEWDIAFRGTTILVNGGTSSGISNEPLRTGDAAAYISTSTFDDVTTVDTTKMKQDSAEGLAIPTGSDNGWYSYNPATRLVSPIPGRILVFRTHDGRYAKMEILSYYKGQDSSAEGQHYSFNFAYQPNLNESNF